MNNKLILLEINEIDRIRPLWEKLNQLHWNDSRYFKDHFNLLTFQKRVEKFYRINPDNLRIEAIQVNGDLAGYCISTVIEHQGEIESLFVEESLRQNGYGRRLAENSIRWMKSKECLTISVSVADGHESVLPFYEKMGFYPRLHVLEWKEISKD
jgi:GNAT superfamily N-acetyltransferase